MKIKMPAQAAKVIQTLEQHGFEAYIVGGCVRDGEQAEHISYGSTLSADGNAIRQFDFMLANPPYGKSWKVDFLLQSASVLSTFL